MRFHRQSGQIPQFVATDRIGPREVIAYLEEQGWVAAGLDRRITDQEGQIMTDHPHLDQTWEITGRNEFGMHNAEVFKFQGKLDKSGRLVERR